MRLLTLVLIGLTFAAIQSQAATYQCDRTSKSRGNIDEITQFSFSTEEQTGSALLAYGRHPKSATLVPHNPLTRVSNGQNLMDFDIVEVESYITINMDTLSADSLEILNDETLEQTFACKEIK